MQHAGYSGDEVREMTLAEKLKALRSEKHLTQEDVARVLDITR